MKKEVTFKTSDGKEYKIKYGMKELIALEEELGVSLMDLKDKKFKVKDIFTMIKVGLSSNNLSEDEIYNIVDELGINRMGELVNEAITASIGVEKKKVK